MKSFIEISREWVSIILSVFRCKTITRYRVEAEKRLDKATFARNRFVSMLLLLKHFDCTNPPLIAVVNGDVGVVVERAFDPKLSYYRNNFLLQYRNIVCKNI